MPSEIISLSLSRLLFIDSIHTAPCDLSVVPQAVLFPAYNEAERKIAESVALELAAKGCLFFSCLGPEAEALEDSLDDLLEELDRSDLATTSHSDALGAFKFLIYGGGWGLRSVVALIHEYPELVKLLKGVSDEYIAGER